MTDIPALSRARRAAEYIQEIFADRRPETALVLGSGLGALAESIESPLTIEYAGIHDFPVSTVPGHAGRIVIGELEGKEVMVFQGRFHYYEGYSMEDVVLPVRVMSLLGIQTLILTNAAGGINTSFEPGDLMCIRDHIKLTGLSPLRGPNIDDFGPRFNDMSDAYSGELRRIMHEAAVRTGTTLREGVYAYMTGPSFETPAEIKMLRLLGADAVGMSTVPEVIVAAHAGMRAAGISTITNMAAGILDQPLSHEEVMETGARVKEKLLALIGEVLRAL
ncbi:MAG: purine-nucleoside phosphorylase [Spirochaetota bacterium]|nr:purine-nucleoside phosphorylase [Spirochaetota bacterium]